MKITFLEVTLVVAVVCFGFISETDAQLFTDDNSLIDQILQVIWEPSSLIRMWVGLDQLFNIVRSWGGVARTLATLPFGEDRSMDHIRIKEPRPAEGRVNLQRQSRTSHPERFNLVYSGHTDSAADVELKRYMALRNQGQLVLPPPILFQPQEVFLNNDIFHLLRNVRNENPFQNRDDEILKGKATIPLDMLVMPSARIPIKSNRFEHHKKPTESAFPLLGSESNVILHPQARLNMFLNLLKNLKESHLNTISSDSKTAIEDF